MDARSVLNFNESPTNEVDMHAFDLNEKRTDTNDSSS